MILNYRSVVQHTRSTLEQSERSGWIGMAIWLGGFLAAALIIGVVTSSF